MSNICYMAKYLDSQGEDIYHWFSTSHHPCMQFREDPQASHFISSVETLHYHIVEIIFDWKIKEALLQALFNPWLQEHHSIFHP